MTAQPALAADQPSGLTEAELLDEGARTLVAVPEPGPARPGPARIIAVVNQKGGVGKTTTAINLAAALTDYGRRVLIVDLDPQGAVCVGLGIPAGGLSATLYQVLTEDLPAADATIATSVPGMDVLPSTIMLAAAEQSLIGEVGRERLLAEALEPIRADYDVILLDCQPSLGLLTVNALAAADEALIPLECEYFALRGVALVAQTIEKVRARINPDLRISGILPTMFDARTVHSREVLQRVEEAYGDQLCATFIPRTVRFPETSAAGVPITVYAPSCSAAKAYRRLAREILAAEA